MRTKEAIAQIIIVVVLGELAPFVFIIGEEPFEVPGDNSFAEVLSGSVALAACPAVCQFKVARMRESPGGSHSWRAWKKA